MSRLSSLVGRSGRFPHKVVHGKLTDQWAVVYKPPSLPLTGDDLGGDSLSARLGGGWDFPAPLEKEEEGLQIVTRTEGMTKFFEATNRKGQYGFGYSAILDIPTCLIGDREACRHLKVTEADKFVLETPNDLRQGPARDTSHIDALFTDGGPQGSLMPTPGACPGCTCKGVPPIPPPAATLHASLHGPLSLRQYNITSPSSATAVRKLLAYHRFPVINDHLYSPLAQQDEEVYYTSLTQDVFYLGLGLACSALKFPDPAVRENWELCFSKTPAEGLTWSHMMVTSPRPPSFMHHLEGDIINRNLEFLNGVMVTGARNPSRSELTAARRTAKLRVKKACKHCLSETHSVEDCPELNSLSAFAKFNKSLKELAGIKEYCVICSSTEHSLVQCSRRKQGVDPATHCPMCGSIYHDVFACPSAAAQGLGSVAKADAHAASCGFSSWKAFADYKKAAEREAKKGARPTHRQVAGHDEHTHKVDPLTLTPDSPQVLTTSLDRRNPYDKGIKKKLFIRHNVDIVKKKHEERRKAAQASRRSKAGNGVDFVFYERVE